MIQVLAGSLGIVLALAALLLQRLYSVVPARELKRLARDQDRLAKGLYRAAAYGSSLRILLWGIVLVGFSVGIVLVVSQVTLPLNMLIVLAVSVLTFVIIPSAQLAPYNAWFAAAVAPFLGWVLSYAHKPLERVALSFNRFRNVGSPGEIFDLQDLLSLIGRQAELPSNRIPADELELVDRALHFNSLRVADILTPRSNLCMIDADDQIGPILLDRLHREGQGMYLVFDGKRDNIIGTLRLQDAIIAKKGGKVREFIRPEVASITDESTVRELTALFQKTGQQFAVVLNDFEEFVGSITSDSLLEHLFGSPESVPSEEETEVPSIAPETSPQETEVVE